MPPCMEMGGDDVVGGIGVVVAGGGGGGGDCAQDSRVSPITRPQRHTQREKDHNCSSDLGLNRCIIQCIKVRCTKQGKTCRDQRGNCPDELPHVLR